MHKIGEPFSLKDRPEVFQLVIEDHLQPLNPKDFGIELDGVNPADAFVTSGDAIKKTEEIERQFLEIADGANCLLESEPKNKALKDLLEKAYAAAGRTRGLINKLILAKGGNCFLETEWSAERTLIVIPKNPRNRD